MAQVIFKSINKLKPNPLSLIWVVYFFVFSGKPEMTWAIIIIVASTTMMRLHFLTSYS